jgi:hypothetical protein
MPSHFAVEPTLSPNGRPMRSNGNNQKSHALEFAELSNETVEPYADAHARRLECDAYIHRDGASP